MIQSYPDCHVFKIVDNGSCILAFWCMLKVHFHYQRSQSSWYPKVRPRQQRYVWCTYRERRDQEHNILLYQVDSFYVEVFHDKERNVIKRFRTSAALISWPLSWRDWYSDLVKWSLTCAFQQKYSGAEVRS